KNPVDLNGIVSEAAAAFEPVAIRAGLTLVLEIAREPLLVVGDSARLRQIVDNLLANAVKFTPSGGRVTLRTGTRLGQVARSVEDTGVGISPETLPVVFDMFRQAVSGAQGGLGIGLSLVRSLVELHAGTVRAESAGIGCGSRFTVSLPRPAGAVA